MDSEVFPSILKKTKRREKRSLIEKSNEIREGERKGKRREEKTEEALPQGCTPLMYACQQGNYKVVVEIIQTDPGQVERRDRGLRCALHYCAEGGQGGPARVACADRLLMAAPALAGARDADGLAPLHLAVVQGNVPLVQLLLAAGADVAAADDERHTVVHWATVCGEVGALRAVLAAGADVATPDKHGGYPLHYAAQMCGAPASVDNQSRGAALEVLRALLKEGGARADVRDADGRTPLLWAASAGSAAAVMALVTAGARVDDADRDGLTALHCAASRGHTECIETLLSLCGARTDTADSNGCTALHYAVTLGHADATALLLQHGADAHRQDRKGRSPAHCGAAKGQLETVRMLGARGANLWLRNSKGDLPLHEAVSSGRRELVKWLLDGRPSQVNATNHDGRTPLHVAASTDNADLCRLLLDRGAEINLVARSNRNEPLTPLDCAITRGYRTTAKYLQMNGCLPASKLNNTQIMIDSGPISALPTRRVTSTRIDVRDRITIEKREVVEMTGISDQRVPLDDSTDDSDRSSDSELYKSNKKGRERKRERSSHKTRRRRLKESQKSFSDGHESADSADADNKPDDVKYVPKKNRSRSEPIKKYNRKDKHKHRHHSSSDSEGRKYRSKGKGHKKRSKRKSSTSSSTQSLSEDHINEQKIHKDKKTSIHIEDDEKRQTVNIVNFKRSDSEGRKNEDSKDDNHDKKKLHSETETDTTSLQNNIVVTEAQVHVDREPTNNSSDITIKLESSKTLSIETSTMKVTQHFIQNEIEGNEKNQVEDTALPIILNEEKSTNEINNISENTKFIEDEKVVTEIQSSLKLEKAESNITIFPEEIKNEPNDKNVHRTNTYNITHHDNASNITDAPNISKDLEKSMSGVQDSNVRKRSFEIITTPEQIQDLQELTKKSSEPEHYISSDGITLSSTKETAKEDEHIMGAVVDQNFSSNDTQTNPEINDSRLSVSRKDYTSTPQSSGDMASTDANIDTGLVSIIADSNATDTDKDRAVKQVILESSHEETSILNSPPRSRKASKDSKSSRKSSLYETESYKVLSDMTSSNETKAGILKKSKLETRDVKSSRNYIKSTNDNIYGRIGSVSDNEMYGASESNGRRKKFRKKGRDKSRSALRSKSENSERGYESSGLIDSGFEPSPRIIQNARIMSPRLSAYYRQRNASGKYSGKGDSRIPVRKPGDKYAVDMKSVTQRIQTNMRRYYCERKIFQHLLELKRLQIRSSKTNEAVFVKRAIDEYNNSSLATVGIGPYNNSDYSFSSFEKFLYDSLRKLQKSGKRHLDRLPERPFDFDYGESELYKMTAVPDNPCLCTNKTHRCFHAVHAYTGVPCSAYIPQKLNHHTMSKPSSSRGFLPKIDNKSKPHVTLEVTHGAERQLISLPSEKLEKNKRYYVTFTVKGSNPTSDNDNKSDDNSVKKS